MKEISVVLPVHNAARILYRNTLQVREELRKIRSSFEIIIAEDGSTDNSAEIAGRLAREYREIRFIHHDRKLGRGGALNYAFRHAAGRFVIYLDVDLEVPLEYVSTIIGCLNSGEKVVIASKRHPLARTKSPLARKLLSIIYNRLARLILNSNVYCHQTGLKGFDRNQVIAPLGLVRDSGWFWDTELLAILQWQGCSIKEIPVNCSYGFEGTTVTPLRTGIDMFGSLLKLRLRKNKLGTTGD